MAVIIDTRINKGKPSIKCRTRGHMTVKGILSLVDANLPVGEIMSELDITEEDIDEAKKYFLDNPSF